jgi:iron complex outermembrane receptor protein
MKPTTTTQLRRLPRFTAGAFALLASAAALPMFAQTTPPATPAKPDEVIKLEAFVSTGSRFNDRTVIDSPVPIDIVSNLEIRAGGYTEANQILQALAPSFNFPRPSVTDGSDHIRPATLRGLAPDQVLVLVNGKRRHSSALVNVNGSIGRGSVSVDLNAIPTTSIGSIEVLRDGAAAQYGSDAISGVINVSLRKDIGYELTSTVGKTYAGDGGVIEGAFDGGSKLGDTGFLHASTYFRHRDQTNRTGRDIRQQYFITRNGVPTIAGVFSGTNNQPVYLAGDVLDPRETTFDRHNAQQGDSDSKEGGIFLNGSLPTASGVEVYGFGGFTKRDGRSAANFRVALNDNNVRAIFPNGFLPFIEAKITDASLTGGAKGRAGDWAYDVSETWGQNKLRYDVDHTVNATLGTASPTHFYAGELSFQQSVTNADLTRNFDIGGRSPLKTAIGAEYRWENFQIKAGEPNSYRNGGVLILDGPKAGVAASTTPGAQGFPGYQPADETNPKRHSYAGYIDFENQVTDQLLLSAAARYEDYSDFGSTFTGKLAARFEFAKGFALRGSVSNGFRAPSLAQSNFSATATNFIGGVPFEIRTFPVASGVAKALGALPLKAEKSDNMSVGFTSQLSSGLTASVDFYEIKIRDRIAYSSNFNDAGTRNFLATQGFPSVGGVRFFTNAVDSRTRGVDFTSRYTTKLANAGKLTLTGSFNINQQKLTRVATTPAKLAAVSTIPLIDRIEVYRYERGQPKNNINLSANYEIGAWSFLAREVRYGEVTTVASITDFTRDQVFSAKWITDVDVGYRFTKNLRVNVGANNVLNVKPDTIVAVNNPSGFIKYSGFSPFGFNGGFYFVRANYKF